MSLLINMKMPTGFQAGAIFPTFPYLFVLLLFTTFFYENTLLSLLFSPRMHEVTKTVFFSLLSSLARSLLKLDKINLSSHDAKGYKIFLLIFWNIY